ncbi:MAG: acetoacetyl-CoA reductase [Hyphomicrobiales bacterium]|nr:acetoacetyl-CoA reductase [Hyphomicrobiales bacterium]
MGHVTLVTGGTRGIGRAISIALKEHGGYDVIASYAGNDEAAAKFKEETGIETIKFDIANFDACAAACKQIAETHGSIEILVNNAGITRDGPLHKMTPDQWNVVISTNLTGAFNMCRNVIEDMRAKGFGRIINISSLNGQKGQFGQCNYAAAKAGEFGLTRSLALENASKGITVNAVAPGYVATEMVLAVPEEIMKKAILPQIPVGRVAEPEEIARCVVFLASDHAGFFNGSTLSPNGGMYMA